MSAQPRKHSTVTTPFLLLLLAFSLYAAVFIYRTSFVINGERYFCLFDDPMISMTYAKNLAHGYGLVWNPGGARVEGLTCPLWIMYMSLVHLLPIPPSKISLCIQVSAAVFLLVNLYLVKKITDRLSNGSSVASLGAVALTAFYLPLNYWCLHGNEVSILTLIVTMAMWLTLQSLARQQTPVWLYLLLGASTLIRLDMSATALGFLVYLAVVDPARRKQHLGIGLAVLAGCVLLQRGAALWYYGELLPNTYYNKVTGYPWLLRMSRGFYVVVNSIWHMNWILWGLPFVTCVLRRDARGCGLPLWILLVQLFYSVYVGGDSWEWWGGTNRFVSIAMPGFFIAFACALATVEQALRRITTAALHAVRTHARAITVGLLAASLLSFNAIHGMLAWAEWWLIKPPLLVPHHRVMLERALLLRRITDPQATIAVVWDGVMPYFAERTAMGLLGKSDKYLARLPKRVPAGRGKWIAFWPGHLGWDYRYSIGQLQPDVVAQLWLSPEEAKPYLDRDYQELTIPDHTLYLRRKSPHILWDQVDRLRTSAPQVHSGG